MKTCKNCLVEKPLEEYYTHKRTRDGKGSWCKKCLITKTAEKRKDPIQKELWKEDFKIVLGVSGGPDSIFLLDFFSQLAKKYPIKLHIAHINYRLREKDSEKDELFVIESLIVKKNEFINFYYYLNK